MVKGSVEPEPAASPTAPAVLPAGSSAAAGAFAGRRCRGRSEMVPRLGQRVRRAVLRRFHLPVRLPRQRPRPGPPGRFAAGNLRLGARLPRDPALRHLGHRAHSRPQLRAEDGCRHQSRAAPEDVRPGLRADRRAQDLAQGSGRHPRPARPALPEERDGGEPGETGQRGRDLRSCPVPDAHFRAQPDGRPPGIPAGPPALVGPEPVHQAQQHRRLLALRPTLRTQ